MSRSLESLHLKHTNGKVGLCCSWYIDLTLSQCHSLVWKEHIQNAPSQLQRTFTPCLPGHPTVQIAELRYHDHIHHHDHSHAQSAEYRVLYLQSHQSFPHAKAMKVSHDQSSFVMCRNQLQDP